MKKFLLYATLLIIPFFARVGDAFDYTMLLQSNLPVDSGTAESTISSPNVDLFANSDYVADTTAAVEEPQEKSIPNPVGLKEFVPNLGRNFVAIGTKQNIAPAAVGSILTWSAYGFDKTIQRYFAGKQHLSSYDRIGDFLGGPEFMIPAVSVLLFWGHHYSETSKFRAMTYSLAQGYLLTISLTYAIKEATGRERPNHEDDLSFVSGHASSAFLWASVLAHYYGKKVYIPVYGVALFVATSRLADNVHWLSDVVGGATLGFIIGNTVARRSIRWLAQAILLFHPWWIHTGMALG